MSVKLFVTDLDGTLLPSGQNVSEKNIKAVQDMVKAGITVTIATGRMYRAAVSIAKILGVDVPIITYNGALIKSVSGEIFYSNYLLPEVVVELTNFFEENDWHLQNYSNDELRFAHHNKFAIGYETSQKVSGVEVGWNEMKKFTENVPKLLSISSNAEETNQRIKILREKFKNKVDVTNSAPIYTEIMSPGVSKASAILILAEKLKINVSEVMAIGDSNNDLPMLKAAGQSIAMGNAVDAVKSVCNFVTDTCENDGFAQAVYKYVL